MSDDSLEKIEPGKRAFLRKIAAVTVFTIPAIQSFPMNGLAASSTGPKWSPPPVSPII